MIQGLVMIKVVSDDKWVGVDTVVSDDAGFGDDTVVGDDRVVSDGTGISDMWVSDDTGVGDDRVVSDDTGISDIMWVSNDTGVGDDRVVSDDTVVGVGMGLMIQRKQQSTNTYSSLYQNKDSTTDQFLLLIQFEQQRHIYIVF